jgi:hypothetical protein
VSPATCPVRALTAWLALPVDKHGRIRPRWLSNRDVARIVKRAALRAGLDSDRYAGHSLRAGLATSAAIAGVEERAIMAQTRHRSVTVARRYIRDGSLFRGMLRRPWGCRAASIFQYWSFHPQVLLIETGFLTPGAGAACLGNEERQPRRVDTVWLPPVGLGARSRGAVPNAAPRQGLGKGVDRAVC